jgi:hypothetical protein
MAALRSQPVKRRISGAKMNASWRPIEIFRKKKIIYFDKNWVFESEAYELVLCNVF